MKAPGSLVQSMVAVIFAIATFSVVFAQGVEGPRHEKVLVYMVDFADSEEGNRIYSMEDIKNSFQIAGYSFADYINRVSRGQLKLEIDFLDSTILTHAQSEFSEFGSLDHEVKTLNELVDLADYDYLMRYWLTGNNKCSSTRGDTNLSMSDGEQFVKIAVANFYGNCLHALAHEFGHSLGAGHTFDIICEPYGLPSNIIDPMHGTESCGQYVPVHEQEHPRQYPFDIALLDDSWATYTIEGIMGASTPINADNFQRLHFLGAWQREFGWLNSVSVSSADKSIVTLASLETLSDISAPRLLSVVTGKALRDVTGDDTVHAFNFEYSEKSPCQLLVTMEGAMLGRDIKPLFEGQMHDALFLLRRSKPTLDPKYPHPYNHNLMVSSATPFIDPYRGIKVSVEKCESESPTSIDVEIERTSLSMEPALLVDFSEPSQFVKLTNESHLPVDFEEAHIGGRHPWAFSILEDSCSNRKLYPTESCEIAMNYQPSGEKDIATLFMPNSDRLRYKASVALYGADAPADSYSNGELRLTETATFFPGEFSLPEDADLLRMTLKIEDNDSEYYDVLFRLDNSVTDKIQFEFVGLYLLEYGYGRAYSPFQEVYLDNTYKKRMKDVENIGTYYPSQNLAVLPSVGLRNSSEVLRNLRLHVDPVNYKVTVLDYVEN